MTALIFLPAFGFLLFVAICWFVAGGYFRRGKRRSALIAFLIPLPFILFIALAKTEGALFLRLTLFDFWFMA